MTTKAPGRESAEAGVRLGGSAVAGLVAALGTIGLMLVGVGRSFDLDESITVGLFVATPSIGHAFTRTYVLNNHLFFSFLDHLVYSSTGSQGEIALRAIPIACSSAAVGLVAAWARSRWGTLASCTAAALMATNPMFLDVGSQVRGYGLLTLIAVATTFVLLDALENDRVTTGRRVLYGGLAAVGVATHLYMLVVVGIHVILALSNRRVMRAWLTPWLGSLLGLAAYVEAWRRMRETVDTLGRRWHGGFPWDLGRELLGGTTLTFVLLSLVLAPTLWRARHATIVKLGALGVGGAIVGIWLVGPFDLYPRFFVWLVPIPVLGVAWAVGRKPAVAVVAAVVIVCQVVFIWPYLTEDPYANREVARVFAKAKARGVLPCVIDDFAALRMVGYVDDMGTPRTAHDRAFCAVLVLLAPAPGTRVVRAADREFRYKTTLHARNDATLWSIVPTSCWLTDRKSGCAIPER